MSPFRVVLVFVALALVGLTLTLRLPVQLRPGSQAPTLTVTYALPDAPPALVEQQATAPLENAFSRLEGLRQMRSVSRYHGGEIVLTFGPTADLDFVRYELAALLRQVYPRLPSQLPYPTVRRAGGNDEDTHAPLLSYALNGPAAAYRLREVAEAQLTPALALLPGIRQVDVSGAEALQVTVAYDEARLRRWGLRPDDLKEALRRHRQATYVGRAAGGGAQHFFIRLDDTPADLSAWERLPISFGDGHTPRRTLRLGEVADIYLEEQTPRGHHRIDGQNAITLNLYAYGDANHLAVATAIRTQVTQLASQLPPGYEVRLRYDDTDYLRKELSKNQRRAGLSVAILIAFLLLVNRNPRYLIVLLSGVAINLALAGGIAYLLGLTVHLYTLAAVAISFGLILDNALVTIDHRHRRGNFRLLPALLAATLTTVAALLLVFLLPPKDRQNLDDFVVVCALNLGVSLLVAWAYTPAAYALWVKAPPDNERRHQYRARRRTARARTAYGRLLAALRRRRGWVVAAFGLAFGLPVFLLPPRWAEQDWYNQTVGSTLYQETLRPHVDRALGGSLRLFVRYVFEKAGYRAPERTRLYVNVEMPFGTPLEALDAVMRELDAYLDRQPGLEQFVTQVYSGQQAQVVITFQEAYERSALPSQLKARLISRAVDYGGVTWDVYGVGKGFSNQADAQLANFLVEMKGYQADALAGEADVLAERLLRHPRVPEVNTDERRYYTDATVDAYHLTLDAARLAQAGTTPARAATALHDRVRQTVPATYLTPNEAAGLLPAYVQSQDAAQRTRHDLMNAPLALNDTVRLRPADFAELRLQRATNVIHKEDRQYIRVVGFDYYGNAKFGNEHLDRALAAWRTDAPVGYTAKKLVRDWGTARPERQYGLLLVMMAAVYAVCAVLFESLRWPWLVLATVPASFVGLFLTFGWFDLYFDQGGYAAFVLLSGLVVNAAIFVLADYQHLCRTSRQPATQLLVKALAGKATPICLTVLSTVVGLVPFLLEGQAEIFWFALAAGTCGGLLFSLLVIFGWLPALVGQRRAV